jgi:replication fork clamp-binding protein CrfC
MNIDLAELKADIAIARMESRNDLAALRTELMGGLAAWRTELRADIAASHRETTQRLKAIEADLGRLFELTGEIKGRLIAAQTVR